MKLSIIVVNWNTRNLLSNCLSSIIDSRLEWDYEVVVVDNGSNDGSQEMIRGQFEEVKLIPNLDNPGFARANNQALRQCSGEFVLLLNPDTVVKPGAIEILVRFLEDTPEAGACGAYLLNPDGSLQESAYPEPTLFREFWRMFHLDELVPYGVYPMEQWDQDQPREVDVLMGACMLIRSKALDEVGLLDEDFYIYSEEVDLCTRLRRTGWSLYWIPTAEVIHFGGQSTRQVAEDMFLHLYEGKILYFRKHHSDLAVLTYKSILLIATLGRLVLTPLAFIERSPKREQHLVLSNNYRRLLWSLPGF